MKLNIKCVSSFLFCMLLVAGSYAVLSLPVTDNFPSSGAEQSWSDYDSSYENIISHAPSAPSGDGYVMDVNDGSGWQYIHMDDDDGSLGDYKITAYIYVIAVTGAGWSRYGIFGRATTTNYTCAHYYLFCDSDGDDYLRCGVYNTESHASWIQFILPDPPGTASITRDAWHKFELSLTGTTIIGEVDDVEVANATDSTFSTGYAGILCSQVSGSTDATLCDRITVEATGTGVDDWMLY